MLLRKKETADPIDLIMETKADADNLQESQYIFEEEFWRRVALKTSNCNKSKRKTGTVVPYAKCVNYFLV